MTDTTIWRTEPLIEPPEHQIHVAEHPYRCQTCKKEEPAGADYAWLYRPNKVGTQRDYKSHPRSPCWRDDEWYHLSQSAVRLDSYDKPVTTTAKPKLQPQNNDSGRRGWCFAMARLRKGDKLRRKWWVTLDNGATDKYIVFGRNKHNKERVYVYTARGKHEYTYPNDDVWADDWEIV